MAWNKRRIVVKSERKFDVKDFRSEKPGATPGVVHRAPTKVELREAEYEIELDINFDKIFEVMGRKAALSSSGRCRDGFVTVRAKKKAELSAKTCPIDIPAWWTEVKPA